MGNLTKKIIIKGFAKETSNWVELEILGGQIEGEFPIKN